MQSAPSGSPIVLLFLCAVALAIYLFYCYCLKLIVEKCGEQPGAIIWVPILQMIPLFRIARMNPWLILLTCVPVANIIILVMVWMRVLKALGRDPIMVLLILFVGVIYIPILAFSASRTAAPARA